MLNVNLPYPLHPMTVHFPIALFMTAAGFEILSLLFKRQSFHQSAVHLYILAALTTPLVVRAGLWEAERIHLNHPLLDKHQLFALWTMWVSLMSLPVLWFVKQQSARYSRILFFILAIGVVGLVILTSHQGGQMVYDYGVGTELF